MKITDTTYEINEKVYTRVTSALNIISSNAIEKIIKYRGKNYFDEMMDEKAKKGKKFHRLTEKMEMGKLKITELSGIKYGDTEMYQMLIQYQQWCKTMIKNVLYTEKTFFNDSYMYAGTLDLIAELHDGSIAVIDKKTSSGIFPSHILQTAAYFELAKGNGIKPKKRIVVQISKDKINAKVLQNQSRDYHLFLNALSLYRGINQI